MTADFWKLIGWGIFLTLLFNGWPRLFTINIHKHYHGPEDKQH